MKKRTPTQLAKALWLGRFEGMCTTWDDDGDYSDTDLDPDEMSEKQRAAVHKAFWKLHDRFVRMVEEKKK